ncbi:NADPH2 dehydrogenase [Paenibacillus sp. UNCCL117]|uniref:NADPH dehydrogenase NamA n=1 Tax=unclassified Paenibacillus TaxID=185978 RepID=UPI000888A3E1|nr:MULTISPECIES: NADPH dehydrogenase NamA [unclassified Paenibacillus]SDE07196.1 NADPH2 dehydrogenase [Paenibacillus sp. cl123]SFW59213.1 NADPH2 dehydrogenase [Paenibacillus sp. UNCCL117]
MLFTSYSIKNLTLKNRIVMSPMCMYACDDESGRVHDWHRVHYPSRAVGQAGLIVVEATAVTAQGRISARDLGIWSDEHIAGLSELTGLVHSHGSHIGIQLAHAGRKALVEGPIVAPSAIAFDEKSRTPEALTEEQIGEEIAAFAAGARRAKEAGFDVIEIHAAHGYLINEFLSPLSNKRDDAYGGDKDRRYRFLHDVVDAVKREWDGPLLVRISAHDYHPEGLTPDDYVDYARRLKAQGVDLIDVSSGAVVPAIPPNIGPGYQVRFARQLRSEAGIATGAVGLITEGAQAEEILQAGSADLIFIGRELLRDPYWPRTAAAQLGVKLDAPPSYTRAW